MNFDEVYDFIIKNNLFDDCKLYNINIPYESKGIRVTCQGSEYFSDRFILTDEENMYLQTGEPIPDIYPDDIHRDTVAMGKGYISITPLMATRTDMAAFEKHKNK